MNFHNESLKALSEEAVVYLTNKGRSQSTINKYVWTWLQIDRYLHDHQIMECEKGSIIGYVCHRFGDKTIRDLTHYQKSCVSQSLNLIQFRETGEMHEIIEYIPKEKVEFKREIGSLMQAFIHFKESRRLSRKTLSNYGWYLYGFQNYMGEHGVFNPQNISPLMILSYCTQLYPGHLGAKHAALCLIREFLRYAYEEKKTNVDLSLVVPRDNYKLQSKLPSTYTKEEVKKILATPDRSTVTGKRNYAILLLIVRLGLRASDVRALSFENIKWARDMISFKQSKTGETVELPLPADVGDAVIDYLKFGRPESSENHIFVEHQSPYRRLKDKAVSRVVSGTIYHSGIDTGYRKHGSHALRHTMAGFLLEGKTPVPVIAEILGHTSVQTTMSYLRVDVENLRQCALDVPFVEIAFYEQKGGAFYA